MKNCVTMILLGIMGLHACTTKDMALNRDNLDTVFDPRDDFYEYAVGGWKMHNPLPDEYSRYGTFDKLIEENQKMVRTMIQEAAVDTDDQEGISQKVGDFYYSGMDTAHIEEMGVKPLLEEFELISLARSKKDIQNLIIRYHLRNNSILFTLYGSPDKKNSEMIIANLYQGGLGLKDVDYYTETGKKADQIRKKYKEFVKKMLVLSGENEESAGVHAETIFSMEDRLAHSSMTRLERRDPHATYNKMKVKKLQEITPDFDWNNYFNNIGLKGLEEINVNQPEFFDEVNDMMSDVAIEDWKAYLKWHLLKNAAYYLSDDFVNASFDFYGKFMSGTAKLQPRWKRVLNATDIALGEAIGKMFVEKHFPAESKERMLVLVGNLKESLHERIEMAEWMSEGTKKEAFAKLDAMNVKIGYPDKWRDYTAFQIDRDSYYDNIQKTNKFNFEYRVAKIGKHVDPDEWGMYAHQVNAYYSPLRNEIVFPAGILQPPFFYPEADDAVNYGAIGVVIGHEMTHGFDDQGRQYDKDGNLRDWWTKEDAENFNTRAEVLVNQFNEYYVTDSLKANGKLTLGENIADLGGLNIAYTALQKALENNPQRKINDFTPEQRFFIAYSTLWGQNITPEEIAKRTKEDVHSIGKLRVNGPLRNLQAFFDTFDVKEGDGMWLDEEKRAKIW